ncbi:MAG: MCE family protein [Pseudomonadales bacterium]|nr:MCE family protein [Pseudomonadales bacterium]
MHKEPLTQEQEEALGDVVLVKRDYFSPIWFVPLIAVFIGAFILYESVTNAGVDITIQFESGDGIEAGSTKVMFKGLPVGVVTEISVNEDLRGITVKANIDKNATSLLKRDSVFWLVQPQISLSGVSGLDALVSGNYIAVQPGEGKNASKFVALNTAPPLDATSPGLHLRLDADSLNSIAEGTNVYYRKIAVGEVKNFELNEKGDGVQVYLRIKEQYAKLVNQNTRFWNSSGISVSGDLSGIKVQAESMVSIITGGISFETPLNGGTGPGKLTAVSSNGDIFRLYADYESSGLQSSSQLNDPNHLHVVLQSESLSSISEGSKIYYRKIPVGEVYAYELNEQETGVNIHVRIRKQFAHLVKPETRFWNVSGISVSGGLSGLKVQTESIASIVSGGIAFHTPARFQGDGGSVEDGHGYQLHEDFDSADVGLLTIIYFKKADGIIEGQTEIKHKGMVVGKVQKVELDKGSYPIKVTVAVDPLIEKSLKKKTEFWLVSPRVALTEIKGLDTIVGGSYITMRVGGGESTRSFYSLDTPPPVKLTSPGLHIVLNAKVLGSVNVGTKLFYRKVPVGEVTDFRLRSSHGQSDGVEDEDYEEGVDIFALIDEEYAYLVRQNTQFWNSSGVTVTGGLSGIKVRAESLLSIMAGGITFDNAEFDNADSDEATPAVNGDNYRLFDGFDEAHEKGLQIEIGFKSAGGLHSGSDLRYKGVTVGKVKKVIFEKGLQQVKVTVLIYPQAEQLANDSARFWIVEPRFGLAATSDLDTLVSGQYIAVMAGDGMARHEFKGLNSAPHDVISQDENALQVSLYAPRLGSVKEGVGVYYRQIRVGSVTGYELSETADKVLIHLSILPAYKMLVRENTHFWNASGVGVDFSLFEGLSIETDSFESILEGGIAFATPNNNKMGGAVESGVRFDLHDEVKKEWLRWKPKISLTAER